MSAGIIGGNVQGLGVFSVTVDPSSCAANTTVVTEASVPGVKIGDVVFLNKPSHETGLGVVNCRVVSADTIEVTFMNTTASGIDEAEETWYGLWARADGTARTNVAI